MRTKKGPKIVGVTEKRKLDGSSSSGPMAPFIELANLVRRVPGQMSLNLLDPEFGGVGGTERWVAALREAARPFENTPLHVPEHGKAAFGPGLTLNNYRFAEAVANTLRQIASLKGMGEIDLGTVFAFQSRECIEVNVKGRITFAKTIFATDYRLFREALEHTDARLIKECPRCQKFFLATRIDKEFCSSNCRQRSWCIKNPDRWGKIQSAHESTRGDKEAKERKRQLGLKLK